MLLRKEIGVDYIGGFSALVHKGMTHSERRLLNALPRALAATERMCASVICLHKGRHQHGRG